MYSSVNLRSPKTKSVIAAIPENRLLLESDSETPNGVNEMLIEMLGVIAEAREWTVQDAIEVTRRYGGHRPHNPHPHHIDIARRFYFLSSTYRS